MFLNVGKVRVMEYVKAGINAVDARIVLLKTNIAPNVGDTWATYSSHEADYSGYTTGGEACTTWGTPAVTDDKAVLTADEIVFAHDGGGTSNTIYVYVLIDADDNTALEAVKLPTPVTMSSLGHTLPLTPTLRLSRAC